MSVRKSLVIFIICSGLMLACAFTVYSFVRELTRPKLPELGKISGFSLVDLNGESFGMENLRGRVWIADFIFTTCGDICPVMSKNMAALSRSFQQVKGINLVSVSVNPEYDTPQVLKNYAQKYKANSNNWYFLTGEREEIKRLALEGFKLGSVDEPIFHSSYFSLVDRNGYIRGFYDGMDTAAINKLFKDAASLLKER